MTLFDLILSHHFNSPAPGDVVLRTPVYRVSLAGAALGTVTARSTDDARDAASERWGGDPDRFSVAYSHSIAETFNVEEAADAA